MPLTELGSGGGGGGGGLSRGYSFTFVLLDRRRHGCRGGLTFSTGDSAAGGHPLPRLLLKNICN